MKKRTGVPGKQPAVHTPVDGLASDGHGDEAGSGLDQPVGHGERAMVAPVFLASILCEARNRKVDLSALLRGLQIDQVDLETPGTVLSHRDAVAVVRRVLQLLPMADRGLELGQRARITERGALALGQLAAATLGEAISLSVRFAPSAGHLLQVREERTTDGRLLVAEPFLGDRDLQRFLVDLTFSTTVQLRRQIASPRYAPSRVQFVCEAPREAAAYGAYFRCPVHFGCEQNALSTHADWLSFPLPWANRLASRLSLQMLERESERFSSMPAIGFSVERAIRRCLPMAAGLAQVAASLNLSERTLRRQLAEMGLSFRQLLDASRKARAFDLMSAGHRSLAEVATAAGFSDPRAFSRAFKRWTGSPPSQIRAYVSALEEPDA